MRIAVLDRDRCQPKKCANECHKYCPMVRTGDETIVFGEDSKPIISEELCSGCGICIKKCPFHAMEIIGLPEELKTQETHRYGVNAFALYGLPIPVEGRVTGILGPNGTGKTTTVKILSGALMPNLGKSGTTWDDVLEHFQPEAQKYMRSVKEGRIRISEKSQSIDASSFKKGELNKELAGTLEINLRRKFEDMSGGELQRVAICACMSRDADLYFFDEITPFLDVYQRVKVAKLVRGLAEIKKKNVVIVEHDLAILDLVADVVHITYGKPLCYGVVTSSKTTRVGINEYLSGFLSEENIRIRPEKITFEPKAPAESAQVAPVLAKYGHFTKKYTGFTLDVSKGEIEEAEVLGVVGPNAIGKSTFVKILAGALEPTEGKVNLDLRISYKPQYIKADMDMSVEALLRSVAKDCGSSYYGTEILKPLQLENMLDRNVTELSGGELQRVAIGACLSRDAVLYILDEPSAHLDVEQRALAIKAIRRVTKNKGAAALVVDHDIYMVDLLSDRLLVFSGIPGKKGKAEGPFEMREGMNRFLRDLGVTFRRDESGRPRINKHDSKKDREQKRAGEYYYTISE